MERGIFFKLINLPFVNLNKFSTYNLTTEQFWWLHKTTIFLAGDWNCFRKWLTTLLNIVTPTNKGEYLKDHISYKLCLTTLLKYSVLYNIRKNYHKRVITLDKKGKVEKSNISMSNCNLISSNDVCKDKSLITIITLLRKTWKTEKYSAYLIWSPIYFSL